ncbi:GPW/gp25 family protein [Streptomyces graminilatus]|uniref:GPW/gp25 family protein n=1 Tax=Streptomyces graminilatus TaxID=1464070 RepID=UPI0006E2C598|nr:GPW/gp25 family protein [Streptomyces graminilatus]
MAEQFVGVGWAFPLHTDACGGIALVARDQEIVESIRIILGTAPGERPMRPEFGCRIHEHVFAPADADTAGRLAYEVRSSLDRWEPRIELDDVVVTPDANDASGTLYIDVRYTVRGTNNPRNLVFPFYVIPSHDAPAAGPDNGPGPGAAPSIQESAR